MQVAALEELKERLPPIRAAISELREIEQALFEWRNELLLDIRQRRNAIIEEVKQRSTELEVECCKLSRIKEQKLVAQREKLLTALKAMEAGCTFAHNALDRGTADPASTLYARGQLLGNLQRMKTKPLVLKPTESARLEFVNTNPTLLQDIAVFGGITGSGVLAANCRADGDGLSSATPGMVATFVVHAVIYFIVMIRNNKN